LVPPAAVAHDVLPPENRRRYADDVPADPMCAAIMDRINTYRETGQRQAVRTMLSSRAGATVVTILASGTGKSAAAYVPALQRSRDGGVSSSPVRPIGR
jgi:hypothetical protein